MLDPNLFATDPESVRVSLRRRNASPETFALVDRLVDLVARRRALTTEGDRCRTVRNELSPKIGALMLRRRITRVVGFSPAAEEVSRWIP